jgi:hypothetical protein
LDAPLLPVGQGSIGLRCEGKRIGRRETLLDDPGALSRGDASNTIDPEAHDFVGKEG